MSTWRLWLFHGNIDGSGDETTSDASGDQDILEKSPDKGKEKTNDGPACIGGQEITNSPNVFYELPSGGHILFTTSPLAIASATHSSLLLPDSSILTYWLPLKK